MSLSQRQAPFDFEVWLLIPGSQFAAAGIAHALAALAAPEFHLGDCRESARLIHSRNHSGYAHWRCRFRLTGVKDDAFSIIRLLKRLVGADLDILRFERLAPPKESVCTQTASPPSHVAVS